MEKISVAIAAYRGEKFIGEQLASIVAQTVVPDEVVICDDSPDELTEKAVMEFSGMLNIRYFRNPSPLGVAGNFNKALELCTGEIVFMADQDDLWYPKKVAIMSKVLAGGGLKAAFCDSDITDADAGSSDFTHLQSRGYGYLRKLKTGLWENQLAQSCRRFPGAGHDMAFTREFLEKVLPIPDIKECHDNYLGLAGAVWDAWICVPQSLGIFRRHDGSASSAGKRFSLLEQIREAKKSVADNTFEWNCQLFSAVLERFPELPPEKKTLLEKRICHSRKRAEMPSGFFKRFPLVTAEWRNGNYRKFGRGWKNVIQDLFLR